MGGGPRLSVAAYRERRLRIEEGEAASGQVRDLILKCVTYVPILRQY